MKHLVYAFLAVVGLAGCASTAQIAYIGDNIERSYKKSDTGDAYVGGAVITENSPFFLSGIFQTHTIDAAQKCGGTNKVIAVAADQDFGDQWLMLFTLGLYTPRTYYVHCK